jgi:hypothetical protein
MKQSLSILVALLLLAAFANAEPLRIATTLVDAEALHFATFQSNNQKVVHNKRGIFMTYNRSRDEKYNAQQWRVMQSTDGGKTFTRVYESTDPTNPPALETDSADNLYIGHPDWVKFDVVLVRLLASEDYRTPHITRAPKASAGKYSMALDEKRQQVCYFSHSGKLVRFGLDGSIKSNTLLLRRGEKAVQEYTHLHLDAGGTLHAAWTSLNVPIRRYWGIHHLQSADGGETWQSFTTKNLPLPIIADETGPSDRITLDDEFEPSTWLANTLTKDGKTHFIYAAKTEPPRQHHVRYDIATGNREIDHSPALRGETIELNINDGFLASSTHDPGSALFAIGRTLRAPVRLACLRSDDNGTTWKDHALSEPLTQPYSVGGCREITPDGQIIGSFTDVTGEKINGYPRGRVYFFRIPIQP